MVRASYDFRRVRPGRTACDRARSREGAARLYASRRASDDTAGINPRRFAHVRSHDRRLHPGVCVVRVFRLRLRKRVSAHTLISGVAVAVIGARAFRATLRAALGTNTAIRTRTTAPTRTITHTRTAARKATDILTRFPERSRLIFVAAVVAAMSGGVAPCPAAIVVMLAALRLHEIGYGMLLIVVFSLGLAAVLSGLGIAVVHGAAGYRGARVSTGSRIRPVGLRRSDFDRRGGHGRPGFRSRRRSRAGYDDLCIDAAGDRRLRFCAAPNARSHRVPSRRSWSTRDSFQRVLGLCARPAPWRGPGPSRGDRQHDAQLDRAEAGLSRFVGTLFAGGHSVMVLAIAALVGYLGTRFSSNAVLVETIGTWISIVVLFAIAAMNVRQISLGTNDRIAGAKTRVLPKVLRDASRLGSRFQSACCSDSVSRPRAKSPHMRWRLASTPASSARCWWVRRFASAWRAPTRSIRC